VEPNQVINIQDLASIYHVPLEMVAQNIVPILTDRLQLSMPLRVSRPRKFMARWRQLADRAEHLRKIVRIALVGKYTQLEDAYASVIKVAKISTPVLRDYDDLLSGSNFSYNLGPDPSKNNSVPTS
jgi:CTP synthase